jgi:hypothetical protein
MMEDVPVKLNPELLWQELTGKLKCGAGEGWRRSVGPIMFRNGEVLLRVKEQRNILHEIVNGRLIGLVTFCVVTAF